MGLLQDAWLAALYDRDIQGLNQLLVDMSARGMPVDQAKREAVALELGQERDAVLAELQVLVPDEAKPRKVYKRKPLNHEELRSEVHTIASDACAYCDARKPNKKHKCWKLKPRTVYVVMEQVEHWIKTLPFKPSTPQLKRFCVLKGYKLPTKFNRDTGETKDTTEETALRRLALKYEAEPVFPLVLKYREVDKVLSTYVGRLVK